MIADFMLDVFHGINKICIKFYSIYSRTSELRNPQETRVFVSTKFP